MRKLFVFLFLMMVVFFQFCSSTKKLQTTPPPLSYESNVLPVILANCSPCHIPEKGNKEPLNTYAAAKEHIDDILVRIQKNPDEKGFMPFKHPKLPDSTIQVFVQWKNEGFVER